LSPSLQEQCTLDGGWWHEKALAVEEAASSKRREPAIPGCVCEPQCEQPLHATAVSELPVSMITSNVCAGVPAQISAAK
jgi:hypothetical protein